MFIKIWFTYGATLLIAVLLTACSGEQNKDSAEPAGLIPSQAETDQQVNEEYQTIDPGKVENGTYSNDYFGISLNFPEEWLVMDTEALNGVMEAGADTIHSDSTSKKKALERVQQRALNLFGASQFPMGESDTNASIMVLAQRINGPRDNYSGADNLEAVKRGFMEAELPYEFGPITSAAVGGKTFDVMKITADLDDNETVTEYTYTILLDDYIFNILTVSYDDESQAVVQKIIDSVTFK
ncbi:hypothetical protein [Paenibacillus jiagnxiensis]|uniref:hypothetical protein n=1 Tax=Paenibacillus jiagnxiensis TaxID=3228926 RepID=UPI0033BB94B9